MPLQRKVFCSRLDVLVRQSLLYLYVLITFFVVFFCSHIFSVAGSFLQFDFISDGPAVFAESEWVDMWRQANWPWLVYNTDVTYVAVSTYNFPLTKKCFFYV